MSKRIQIPIRDLIRAQRYRPPGYMNEVLSRAKYIDDKIYQLDRKDYDELCVKYRGSVRKIAKGRDLMGCVHRGEYLQNEDCTKGCGKGKRVKVFQCSVFGECTIANKTELPSCDSCLRYQSNSKL